MRNEPPIEPEDERLFREIVIEEKRVGIYDLMTLRRMAGLLAKIDQLRGDVKYLYSQLQLSRSDLAMIVEELPAKKRGAWMEMVLKREQETRPPSEMPAVDPQQQGKQ